MPSSPTRGVLNEHKLRAGAARRRGYTFRRLLAASDVLALCAAFGVVDAINALAGRAAFTPLEATVLAAMLPLWMLLAHGAGLYHLSERRVDHGFVDEVWPVFVASTIWAWAVVLVRAAVESGALQVFELAVLWLTGISLVLVGRALVRRVARGREWYRQPVLVVGDSSDVDRVLTRIRRHLECGLDPIAVVRITPAGFRWQWLSPNGSRPPLGDPWRGIGARPSPLELADHVEASGIGRVIVTGWPGDLSARTELIRVLAGGGVSVDLVSGEPEALCSTGVVHHLEGLPMLSVQPVEITRLWAGLKRAFDVAISTSALMAVLPLFAYVAIRIKLGSAGPVLFRQQRAGRDSEPFELLKFRTMFEGAETMRGKLRDQGNGQHQSELFKLHDDPRVTSFGDWLRRWSIDELPQLWNVLRGDMSLVGPRPLPLDEALMATGHYTERARVRPGITGPWQIHGRSDIPFDDMVKLDYTYVASWRMGEDIRLLVRTVGAVLGRRGAY